MLNEKIKLLRQSTGMSARKFADSINVKYTTYYGYETGSREPDSDFIVKIALAFSVSTDYLLGLQDGLPDDEKAKPSTATKVEVEGEAISEIIEIYENLNVQGREQILKHARYCSSQDEYKKRANIAKMA